MGGCEDEIKMKMQPEELDMVFEPLGDAIKNVANLTRSGGSQALKIRGVTKEQIAVAFHALLKYVETGEKLLGDDSETDSPEEEVLPPISQLTTADSVSNVDTAKTEFKKSGKVCPKLRNSKCEFGFRGEKCPDEHPKICKKFLENGKFEWGCHEIKCPKLHIRLCKSSYRNRTCFNEKCSWRHLPKTKRKPDTVRSQVQHPAPWIREPTGYGRSQFPSEPSVGIKPSFLDQNIWQDPRSQLRTLLETLLKTL